MPDIKSTQRAGEPAAVLRSRVDAMLRALPEDIPEPEVFPRTVPDSLVLDKIIIVADKIIEGRLPCGALIYRWIPKYIVDRKTGRTIEDKRRAA